MALKVKKENKVGEVIRFEMDDSTTKHVGLIHLIKKDDTSVFGICVFDLTDSMYTNLPFDYYEVVGYLGKITVKQNDGSERTFNFK